MNRKNEGKNDNCDDDDDEDGDEYKRSNRHLRKERQIFCCILIPLLFSVGNLSIKTIKTIKTIESLWL